MDNWYGSFQLSDSDIHPIPQTNPFQTKPIEKQSLDILPN